MKIAFVTTQALSTSTVVGRILPLAHELKKHEEVVLYVMSSEAPLPQDISVKEVGQEPFIRADKGKIRLKGLALIAQLLKNTWQTFTQLLEDKPDVIVIVKSLPQNTLAVAAARLFHAPKKIILDCDDFELAANVLTSIWQRAVIHMSERLACAIAHECVAATPFIQDHLGYLTNSQKRITLIPTGIEEIVEIKNEDVIQLLYAGSISISSGHAVGILIPMLKELVITYPNITLHIAGSGDDVTTLKNAATASGVDKHIVWHGRFTPSTLQPLLTSQTILLDPIDASVVARAKSSFRCMLSLATGLPVITSNIGIRSALIPSELHDSFFAQPDDMKSYVQKVAGLIDNPLSQSQKASLQASAKQYLWSLLASTYWDILKR
jgi:glycosyltransferase involved in cell wall biosynthesis